MDLPYVVVVSLVLLLAAAGLIVSHIRSWREYVRLEANAEDFDYRRRQYRRRMQTSAMLGILGIAVPAGYLLTLWLDSGWFAVAYWTAIMGLAFWVVLLALVDIWATKHHFGRLRDKCFIERVKLEAELHHLQSIRGNGKAKAAPRERKNEP
jgi:hypothetical protein